MATTHRIALTLLLVLIPIPAMAQRIVATGVVHFYVSPTGSDTNDCLAPSRPCRDPNRAASIAQYKYDLAGYGAFIHFAPGTYNTSVNIAGQPLGAHTLDFYGDCSNPAAVVVNAPPGTPAFWIQDLAIGVIQCLTVQGDIGISGRQHVVVDIANVIFAGARPGGPPAIAIAMGDSAVANLGGTNWISGDMVVFAASSSGSMVRCAWGVGVVITRPVKIDYFVDVQQNGVVTWENGCHFDNAGLVTGMPYVLYSGGTFQPNGILTPGNQPGLNALGTGRLYP